MEYRTYQKPDMHMHSVYSDGTDTPRILIDNVRKAGIDLFALTDHDTAEGCSAVQELLQPGDPRFIGGIEFSCKDQYGKYHILGYCYDPEKSAIKETVKFSHDIRIRKLINRFAYLKQEFGFTFSDSEREALMALPNPGKPHFAALMLEKGYVKTKSDGFAAFENYHGTEPSLSPEDAIDAIYRADGLPVLAHGILADGSRSLTEQEIESRVARFKQAGLMGLECYYSTFTPEQKAIMLSLAKKYNMFVTAGSDYHGTNKPVKLGQTNDPDLSDLQRFYAVIEQLL